MSAIIGDCKVVSFYLFIYPFFLKWRNSMNQFWCICTFMSDIILPDFCNKSTIIKKKSIMHYWWKGTLPTTIPPSTSASCLYLPKANKRGNLCLYCDRHNIYKMKKKTKMPTYGINSSLTFSNTLFGTSCAYLYVLHFVKRSAKSILRLSSNISLHSP